MIDVKSKKCNEKDCDTRPIFNYPDKTKGIFCVNHKLEGMINVKDKHCQYDNCSKIPHFIFILFIH